MKDFIKIGLAAVVMAVATDVMAQDKVEATVSADVVNQYIWRGTKCGEASVQPTLGVAYKGLSLTAWGSTEIAPKDVDSYPKEFDLTLAYSLGGFNVGVTDYFFTGGDKYFMYNTHRTAHVFEANVGYDFGPVSVQWYTNFAGSDYAADGKRKYSSYFELNAPFKVADIDFNATLGAVPFEDAGVYGACDGFAVTNVAIKASKELKITPSFSLPVFTQVVANPHTEDTYFVVGMTFIP